VLVAAWVTRRYWLDESCRKESVSTSSAFCASSSVVISGRFEVFFTDLIGSGTVFWLLAGFLAGRRGHRRGVMIY
jgi:hypothetical protein